MIGMITNNLLLVIGIGVTLYLSRDKWRGKLKL
jgi:hypothetical protein